MPELSKGVAHQILTQQEFDYFESRREAEEYAAFTDRSPDEVLQTDLGYSKVPRDYSIFLGINFNKAMFLLSAPGAQPFVHIDHSGIALGQTDAGNAADTGPALLIPPRERSCSILLGSASGAAIDPRRNNEISRGQGTAVNLPLGRHILTPNSQDKEHSLAIYDSFREWERVLIVGETAIKKFLHMSFYEQNPLISDKQRAARIGQVGLILHLEKELDSDSDLRAVLGDREIPDPSPVD